MSTPARISPFSVVILVLVGRDGAGPHDLRRMAEQGRFYWEAAPSQWYAEPKRLEKLGLLKARKQPGQTHQRTHYMLTAKGRKALEEWMHTPAPLPKMQHESIVRLLAADLVDPAAVLEGLEAMGPEIDAVLADLQIAKAAAAGPGLAHRRDLLTVNHDYAQRLLDLQREWLADARRVLRKRVEDD